MECAKCIKLQHKLDKAILSNTQNVDRLTMHYQGRIDALERQIDELRKERANPPKG